ncbi:MAG: phenylalanine--tRNA ligase subunit beta [Candidatus Micrarchaeia archaeon]
MATTSFYYTDFESLGISRDKINELVPKIGMEIKYEDKESFTIDITPNRPDLLDFVGLVRALMLYEKRQVPSEDSYKLSNGPYGEIKMSSSVNKIRGNIAAVVAKNVDLSGNKLKYLINFAEKLSETYGRKRKLLAIGIHNLDVIKWPLLYSAESSGSFIPLNSSKNMSFEEILNDTNKGVEYANLVQRNNYVTLRDQEKILSFIPVINSEATKVTTSTKNILIDITGTSYFVNDASKIIACSLIDSKADVFPCKIVSKNEIITPSLDYKELKLKKSTIENTIGSYKSDSGMISLLNRMGHLAFDYGNNLIVKVPPYRTDIIGIMDIVEDVAISYGYNNINPIPLPAYSSGSKSDETKKIDELSEAMIGLGFTEVSNMILTSPYLDNFRLGTEEIHGREAIHLEESKSENNSIVRTNLLPGILSDLELSANRKMPQKIFEIGEIVYTRSDKIISEMQLAFAIEHSKANFSEAISTLNALAEVYQQHYKISEHDSKIFIKGRSITINSSWLNGILGELHPKILSLFRLEAPVVAAEFTLWERQYRA